MRRNRNSAGGAGDTVAVLDPGREPLTRTESNAFPPAAPLYGRLCDVCGHLELDENPLLLDLRIECPACAVRIGSQS